MTDVRKINLSEDKEMFIIWGTKTMDKVLGYSKVSYQCGRCHNAIDYKIFRRMKWFTLFWIPIIPLSCKYYIACPICNYGSKITKAEALEQIRVENYDM